MKCWILSLIRLMKFSNAMLDSDFLIVSKNTLHNEI
jgi:hypothetical protein